MSVIGEGRLTPRQQRFLTEYLIDGEAVPAAIRAGYHEKRAEFMANQNLRKPEIQCAIRAAQAGEPAEITKDDVLREYARIAFFDPRKLFRPDGSPKPIEALDDDTAAALVGIDVREEYEGAGEERVFTGYTKKYKLANKLGALNSLAKHIGLFDSRQNSEMDKTTSGVILMPEVDTDDET